jgi:hypothetical protein
MNYTSDEILEASIEMFRRIAKGEIRYHEEISIFPLLAEFLMNNLGEFGK